MTYANKTYYFQIKHPVTGDSICAVPTGKTRQGQSESQETEAEVIVITPGARINKLWIKPSDLVKIG